MFCMKRHNLITRLFSLSHVRIAFKKSHENLDFKRYLRFPFFLCHTIIITILVVVLQLKRENYAFLQINFGLSSQFLQLENVLALVPRMINDNPIGISVSTQCFELKMHDCPFNARKLVSKQYHYIWISLSRFCNARMSCSCQMKHKARTTTKGLTYSI